MSRVYEALRRAEIRRGEVGGLRVQDERDDLDDATRELADDVNSLAALVRRLELDLERRFGERDARLGEHLASLEVSIDALEDRFEERPAPGGGSADATALLSRLTERVRALEDRLSSEGPNLRAELDETIEKRMQQLAGRDQITRDRFEARLDALRRDLDADRRRQAFLIAGVLLTGLVLYAC